MSSQQSEESAFFSALFSNSQINAFIRMDTTGIIKLVNPSFRNHFGWADQDVNGKHFSILFTAEDRASGKPAREIENALKNGQANDKNFMMHKNGEASWVSGESILIKHANGNLDLLKMIQDINVQKESESSLSRSNTFNENILNAIDDFVIVLDKSLHVLKYNPSFSRLFRNGEVPAMTDFAAFIQPYDSKEELKEKILQVMQSGIPFHKQTIEILTSTGERVFDISCQLLQVDGQGQAFMLVGRDTTMQKRVDAEREDIMGFVAHELRNPLASILMSNDLMGLMINENRPDQLKALLEKNKKNIERLNMMTTELYDATKVAGGGLQLKIALFDFDAMIEEAVETFRILEPGCTYVIEGKSGLSYPGDQYRINQVVSNFLSNGVKYCGKVPEIKIKITADEKNVTVAVEDRGLGIPSTQMPYVFDRFFRAEKTRNLEGIGLGLYLCRRIIQAHGGKIWAESKEGDGSVFYFNLPVIS